MGFKDRLRFILPKKRQDTNRNAAQLSDATTLIGSTPFTASHTSTIRRQTTDFIKRRGAAAARPFLIKLNFIDRDEGVGEAFRPRPLPTSIPASKRSRDFDARYIEIKHLADGGNGQVHLCRDRLIGTLVAVKTVQREYNSVPNEVRILRDLGEHENVVQCYDVLDHPTCRLYQKVIFEYCEMGDLADYSTTLIDGIPEMFIWNVFAQLSKSLSLLHQKGIVHGDLKMSNILVIPGQRGETWPHLKLADFGASQNTPPRHIPRAHLGTWECNPPESDTHFGTEGDVWSLGAIVHVLALGHDPFREVEMAEKNVHVWFERVYGGLVMEGTPCPKDYKDYCYWHAQHPCSPSRIDREHRHECLGNVTRYSKLLNYWMMRCLDMDYRPRISAFELNRFVPALETFCLKVMTEGHEDLLDRFNDGRDTGWVEVSEVTDSQVLQQMYFAVSDRAHRWASPGMMRMVRELPRIMDAQDYADACRITGRSFDGSMSV